MNESKSKAIALAVTALFVLSSLAVLLPVADADETGTASYTINMRVGDTFDYNPKTNVDGTELTWSRTVSNASENYSSAAVYSAVDGLMSLSNSTSSATLFFKPTVHGDTTVTLTAYHEASNQRIVQTINFHVINKMTFTATGGVTISGSAGTVTILPATPAGDLTTITATNGVDPEFDVSEASLQFKAAGADSFSTDTSGIFTATEGSSANKIVIALTDSPQLGIYRFMVPISWGVEGEGAAAAGENVNFVLDIVVSDGVTVAPNTTAYVVAGQTSTKDIPLLNNSNVTSIEFSVSSEEDELFDKIVKSVSGTAASGHATLTLDASAVTNDDFPDESAAERMTLTIGITGTEELNGVETPFEKEGTVQVTVYKSLFFVTSPVINASKTTVYSSTGTGLDILLITTITGASKITYDWGDGKSYTRSVGLSGSTYYSANHTYDEAGTYFITITASNDFGETSYVTPYTTTGNNVPLEEQTPTIKAKDIKAQENNGRITLSADYKASMEPDSVLYSWFYKESGGDKTLITAATAPEYIQLDGNNIVITKNKAPKEVTFYLVMTATFPGSSETVSTDEVSYSLGDSGPSQKAWLVAGGIGIVGILALFAGLRMGNPRLMLIAFIATIAGIGLVWYFMGGLI